MPQQYRWLIPAMWFAWMAYWWIAARDVKTTARHESVGSRLAHIAPLLIAGVLLGARRLPIPMLYERFLPAGAAAFFVGAALVAAGLAFAAWARVFLGRNWSGTVTLKQDHELIRGGPYALVRHPIYTGLLLAVLGTAIAIGEWRGLVAFVIAFVALWRKLRLEERWMVETFGDAYMRYRSEVAALIPFVF